MSSEGDGVDDGLREEGPPRHARETRRSAGSVNLPRKEEEERKIRQRGQAGIWKVKSLRQLRYERLAFGVHVVTLRKKVDDLRTHVHVRIQYIEVITYLTPNVSLISYKIPHSLLTNTPVIANFGGLTVHTPVGLSISSSISVIASGEMPAGASFAWTVNGHAEFGGSSEGT
jgi:hypothetical protein